MANIIGCKYTNIVSGALGNKRATSCAGVPGQGLPSAYVYANFGMKLAVDTNSNVYVAISGGYIQQYGMMNYPGGPQPEWYAYVLVKGHWWEQRFDGDWWQAEAMSECITSALFLSGAGLGLTGYSGFSAVGDPTTSDEALAMGFKHIGTLNDIETSVSESYGIRRTYGRCYIMIPILYHSIPTDPVYLSAMGFDIDITEILDYFPGAIRNNVGNNGQWTSPLSCNRAGGYFRKLNNNLWIDRKNRNGDSSFSTVFIYNNGSFSTIAPLLGM